MPSNDQSTVYLECLGTVQVEKINPCGSAVVRDLNGRLWLVTAEEFSKNEVCLLSGE